MAVVSTNGTRVILLCGPCHGTGFFTHRWVRKICPLCAGVGTRQWWVRNQVQPIRRQPIRGRAETEPSPGLPEPW